MIASFLIWLGVVLAVLAVVFGLAKALRGD